MELVVDFDDVMFHDKDIYPSWCRGIYFGVQDKQKDEFNEYWEDFFDDMDDGNRCYAQCTHLTIKGDLIYHLPDVIRTKFKSVKAFVFRGFRGRAITAAQLPKSLEEFESTDDRIPPDFAVGSSQLRRLKTLRLCMGTFFDWNLVHYDWARDDRSYGPSDGNHDEPRIPLADLPVLKTIYLDTEIDQDRGMKFPSHEVLLKWADILMEGCIFLGNVRYRVEPKNIKVEGSIVRIPIGLGRYVQLLGGLHQRCGAKSLFSRLQRKSSLFDVQLLRYIGKLAGC